MAKIFNSEVKGKATGFQKLYANKLLQIPPRGTFFKRVFFFFFTLEEKTFSLI